MGECVSGQIDRPVGGEVDEQMGGWVDKWMDGWTGEQTDGWICDKANTSRHMGFHSKIQPLCLLKMVMKYWKVHH